MKRAKLWAMLAACPLFLGPFTVRPVLPQIPLPQPEIAEVITESPAAPALSPSQLTAKSAILIDADSGQVLFEKNADVQRAPASTTKIMTLWLAVEKMPMNRQVTVPESAAKAPADSTRVPVYPGEVMPFEDLLYGLMIKSGNDAANAIGTLTAGSVDAFVAQMNQRAGQLGLTNTQFRNAHGYPASGHYTTARDLSVIMRAAMKNQDFLRIMSTRKHVMAPTALRDSLSLSNTYSIFNHQSEYYYPYAILGKTGYASAAGQCFVSAARKEGRTLISVVLNAGGTKGPKWEDARRMFEYGFKRLEARDGT